MADVQFQSDDRPHDNMVTTVRAVLIVTAIIPLVICLLRLYVRWFVVQWFGWDDVFVIPALIGVLGWHAVAIVETFYGLGRHMWDIPPASLRLWYKEFFVLQVIYLSVSSLMKTSVILFLMRIFAEVRNVNVVCKGLVVFLVAFTIAGTLVITFQCKPIRAAYTPGLSGSKCFTPNTLFGIFLFQAVTMFVTDVIILILPMPHLVKLKLPFKKRIGVIILFSLGFIATIAALVRFSTLAFFKGKIDYTYTSSISHIWMGIEFSIGLTTASLPSLRPIITWKGVNIFSNQASHSPEAGTPSNSRRKPCKNSSTEQSWPMETVLSAPQDERITKTTDIDIEVGHSESTEHIIQLC